MVGHLLHLEKLREDTDVIQLRSRHKSGKVYVAPPRY